MKTNKKFTIYLEITRVCNLKCPFCPSRDITNHSSMNLDEIKKVLNKIKNHTAFLYFHVLGEPTLHPNFIDCLKYAEEVGIDFGVTTNATNLKVFSDDVLKLEHFKKINISIQSFIQFDQDRIQRGLNELDEFLIRKNSINSYLPVNIRFWNDKENHEVIKLNNHINDFLDNVIGINDFRNVRKSLDDEFKWPDLDDSFNNVEYGCLGGKKQLGILNDGSVVLCCLDYYGSTCIGNILNSSFEEILNSTLYQKVIKGINDRMPYFELCQKCTYRNRFKK